MDSLESFDRQTDWLRVWSGGTAAEKRPDFIPCVPRILGARLPAMRQAIDDNNKSVH